MGKDTKNRIIKFRGKQICDGVWVYGNLIIYSETDYEIEWFCDIDKRWYRSKVIPETVGQFTGLRDKNEKEIYEGDIVKTKEYGIEIPNGKVSFNSVGYDNFIINYIDGGFRLSNNHRCFLLCRGNHLEVNGNIYNNPELLKGDKS